MSLAWLGWLAEEQEIKDIILPRRLLCTVAVSVAENPLENARFEKPLLLAVLPKDVSRIDDDN